MKLEFIRVENFRQFYGQQDADFSIDDELNVTVFHGVNGAGKTSLFSAINWCLYNAGVEDIGQLVSKKALAEASEGESFETKVIISFLHRGNRYIARRALCVKKSEKRNTYNNRTEFSLMRIKASGDAEELGNPVGYMNAILPANVRPYFFFDGEKMDDLTRADNQEVEEAIRNVMRLPALERAERHLGDIASDYRREMRKQGSPELERLIAKEEDLRAEKERVLRRRDELKEEIRLARQQIADLESKLREKEATRELQERRDRIQGTLEQLDERERLHIQSIQQITNRAYISLLPRVAQKALAVLDEKRERGEIPSGIREQFVQDLLDNLECICGRPFQKDDQVYNNLSALLKRTTSSELESEVMQLGGDLRALSSSTNDILVSLESLMSDHANIRRNKDQLYKERDDVRRQLRDVPEEEIAGLEKQRSKFQRNLELLISERGRTEQAIENLEQELDGTINKKRRAEAKEKKLKLLARKEELTQKAADAVSRIKDEFFERTREEIEAATREVFDKLAWKQDHFQDIRLDQDFRLEVIDRWGTPTRKELSAGERQILSLSFICAMTEVSGEVAPLVMDTPFGRLSGNHLEAVAEDLPDLASQLVLFVTDREWDEASRTGLEPRTSAQYELKFDLTTGCTAIEEMAWL
jgi:DNA sulfur modification protein DndD